jgi:hypothetical protein
MITPHLLIFRLLVLAQNAAWHTYPWAPQLEGTGVRKGKIFFKAPTQHNTVHTPVRFYYFTFSSFNMTFTSVVSNITSQG